MEYTDVLNAPLDKVQQDFDQQLLSKSLNVTVCKRYGFFSVLAAIIRENSDKRPWIEKRWRLHCSFINLTEWRERRVTC